MAITYPLATNFAVHFGGPTISASINVGTGSNRRIAVLMGYSGVGSTPVSFAVGSDTIPLIGSVVTTASNFEWALFEGPLTVSGSQTYDAEYTGGFGSGFAEANILVSQGGAALTFGHALAPLEQSGGGAASSTRTVTSVSGDVGIMLAVDVNAASAATAQSPGVDITNDWGSPIIFFAMHQAATTTSTALQFNWAAAHDPITAAFTYTEAGGPPANPTPTFSGSITNISATESAAIAPISTAARFSDTDALTYSESPAGTAWPAGLVINSSTGIITGTMATVAVTSGCKVRATDTAAQTVDSNAFSVTVSLLSVTLAKTVTVILTTDGTTPRPSLTGLNWAFFDQVTPDTFTAPVDQGTGETTDGTGTLTISVATTLTVGGIGWLVVSDSDGTITQSPVPKVYSGPVAVAA